MRKSRPTERLKAPGCLETSKMNGQEDPLDVCLRNLHVDEQNK